MFIKPSLLRLLCRQGHTRRQASWNRHLRDFHFQSSVAILFAVTTSTSLAMASEGVTRSTVDDILRDSNEGRLSIIDSHGRIVSLLARSDILLPPKFPKETSSTRLR